MASRNAARYIYTYIYFLKYKYTTFVLILEIYPQMSNDPLLYSSLYSGSTLDSHRLIFYAGQKGPEKQHNLVEELCLGYFTQERYIGDRQV